jgi:hypothetical protein
VAELAVDPESPHSSLRRAAVRELPPIAFWVLPTLIDGPILLNAFVQHPLVRRPRLS